MKERSIKIVDNRTKSQKIMENKTLMEFTVDYIKEKELKNEVFLLNKSCQIIQEYNTTGRNS